MIKQGKNPDCDQYFWFLHLFVNQLLNFNVLFPSEIFIDPFQSLSSLSCFPVDQKSQKLFTMKVNRYTIWKTNNNNMEIDNQFFSTVDILNWTSALTSAVYSNKLNDALLLLFLWTVTLQPF